MHITIQTRGFSITESLRLYVLQRIRFVLGWAGIGTRKLAVVLSDINGPRGGNDKRCKIQVQLVGGKDLVIEDTEADMYVAIDRAAERADRALVRRMKREREVTHLSPAKGIVIADDTDTADDSNDVTEGAQLR